MFFSLHFCAFTANALLNHPLFLPLPLVNGGLEQPKVEPRMRETCAIVMEPQDVQEADRTNDCHSMIVDEWYIVLMLHGFYLLILI